MSDTNKDPDFSNMDNSALEKDDYPNAGALKLEFLKIHARAILFATIFAIIVAVISYLVYASVNQWKQEVVQTNKTLAKVICRQLYESSEAIIDSLAADSFFAKANLTVDEIEKMDSRLKELSQAAFASIDGMEGGFFFSKLDEFYGYSFPTSPPPKPVYGPPPRSYNIIRSQAVATIETGRAIVDLHQFDPAIFPLATEPIMHADTVIGATWARIHIERELPTLKMRQVINVGAIISLLGFIIAVFMSVLQRRKIMRIHSDLEIVKTGAQHDVTVFGGSLGHIGRSINSMLKALRTGQGHREQLERELHRKEKMASLGILLAGVAHEVKTPLAVIKTRVQIWQQEGRNGESKLVGDEPHYLVSEKSMKLVISEIDRLSDLMKRLLYFSKPKSEKLRPTDINALINHTIQLVESRNGQKKVSINTDFDEALPSLKADPNALEQVFINILLNSIQSIDEEGTIDISTRFDSHKRIISIECKDTGSGIPDYIKSKIFDPFFTTKERGFGLGLSISYEILTAHGGTIAFRPNKPRGTICTINIPCPEEERGQKP